MKQWHDILRKVMENGVDRPDRTGIGTRALFGEQLEFDNSATFPVVTTKRLAFRQVCAELACFIRGQQWLSEFNAMGCTIWDGNAMAPAWLAQHKAPEHEDVWLGRIYGVQWRNWRTWTQTSGNALLPVFIDQLQMLIDGIRKDPYGRRHLITAWNPGELNQVCLPACHVLFQCFVAGSVLDLRVDMRSVDLFLGLPFDIASYAVLQRLLALEAGYESGRLVFQLGDAHIYTNHFDQVAAVLSRPPRAAPQLDLQIPAACSLFDFLPEHARLVGYVPHEAIAAPLNV